MHQSTITIARILSLLFLYTSHTQASCECGYSTTVSGTEYVFTEVLETDFVHLANVSADTDWVRQEFNVSANNDRGEYGESTEPGNVISNPIANNDSWAGPGTLGGDAGLELYVRSVDSNADSVPTAEIDTAREDMFYGTYRAGMHLTDVVGTCGAFFWYYNDSQEIDMEFLSTRFNSENNSYPVQLVLQSEASVANGYDASNTNTYVVAYLPFNPTDGFHEYRFDFIPGHVLFYADGQVLAEMNASSAIPTHAGHLILSHWSNGNKDWSAGPPTTDASITVSYVKAYFNSSDTQRQSDWSTRCSAATGTDTVCAIPDQTVPPNPDGTDGNSTADVPFFMNQPDSTDNQTIYHQSSGASRMSRIESLAVFSPISILSLLAFALTIGL